MERRSKAEIEKEMSEVRKKKMEIWERSTPENTRRTLTGLSACNARLYKLGQELRSHGRWAE